MTSPIKKLEIHLDHDIDEQYQYEPGEVLSGQVVLILSEDMYVKSIVIQIKGEATVGLDTENGKNDDSNLTASEIYVDESVSVYDQQTPTVLSKGNHSFPLEYNLPESLPSSFIGKFGSVTYVVKATLKQGNENQMGLGSNITSEPFLVLRRYDLSNMQELKRPRTIKLSKKSACYLIFCNSKIEAEFQVAKVGFLPGEDIVINAQIENNYPSNIRSILAVLLLNSKFHAKNQSRTHSQIVNKKVDSLPVEHGGERVWTDLRLPVPPFIPESNLEGCVLIDIQYVLQFKIEFDDETDVEASIPVVIGTPETDRRHSGKPAWDENEYPISTGNNFILSNDNFKDVDINVDAKDLERFRHPMVDGEMKENILFQDDE